MIFSIRTNGIKKKLFRLDRVNQFLNVLHWIPTYTWTNCFFFDDIVEFSP